MLHELVPMIVIIFKEFLKLKYLEGMLQCRKYKDEVLKGVLMIVQEYKICNAISCSNT